MKKSLRLISLCSVVFIGLVGCSKEEAGNKEAADQLFTNGTFYTMDDSKKTVEAVAVKNGEILDVGTLDEMEKYSSDSTKKIDLQGKTVVPGFVDSHTHVGNTVEIMFGAQLSDGESFEDYIEIIKEYMEKNPTEEAIFGAGWISPFLDKAENPKKSLDALSTEKPFVLIAEDRHTVWLNSKALEMAGISKDAKDPSGGKIGRLANGELNGVLYETAAWDAIGKLPTYSMEDMKESLIAFEEMALERGITQVNNVLIYNEEAIVDALLELEKENKLNVTHYLSFAVFPSDGENKLNEIKELKKKLTGSHVKFNAIKIFDDGVIEGATALLLNDYSHQHGYKGFSIWEDQQFFDTIKKIDKEKIQIQLHVIGDGALKKTLDALEEAKKENGTSGMRHKITHLQLASQEDIKRMGELEVTAILQPNWAYKEDGFYEQGIEYLGQERTDAQYPLQSFIDAGVRITSSSDFPVTVDWSPLEGMEVGVTRSALGDKERETALNPKEAATIEEMMKSYTINGTYANFAEKVSGSITKGKEADFVVLEQDVMKAEPHTIAATKILYTYNDGKIVFEQK